MERLWENELRSYNFKNYSNLYNSELSLKSLPCLRQMNLNFKQFSHLKAFLYRRSLSAQVLVEWVLLFSWFNLQSFSTLWKSLECHRGWKTFRFSRNQFSYMSKFFLSSAGKWSLQAVKLLSSTQSPGLWNSFHSD